MHVVTVNDYLARRDAAWMSPIYDALGVTVGVLQNQQAYDEKQLAYSCDVVYGTNSEFGFDYLRDNMAKDLSEKVQRGHPVRGRGRGRQHPDRRGPHAVDHLRSARTGRRPVREVRASGAVSSRSGETPEAWTRAPRRVSWPTSTTRSTRSRRPSPSQSMASPRRSAFSASTISTRPRTVTWSTT